MGRPPKIPSPWGNISPCRSGDRTVYRLRGPIAGEMKSCGLYNTIAEAQQQAEALRIVHGGVPAELTVYLWCMKACDARELRGKRDVHETRGVIQRYVYGHRIANIPIRQLRPEQVRQWIHDVSQRRATRGKRAAKPSAGRPLGKPISQNTVRNALRALSALCSDAIEAGRATRNPCLRIAVPKVPRDDEPWTYLTPDEVRALLAHPALTVPPKVPQKRRAAAELRQARQRTILTVAIYSGLRAGELWGLRWEDVRLAGDAPELIVCRSYDGPTKGGRPRRVPLLPPARDALLAWRSAGGSTKIAGLVFPGDVNPATGAEETHKEGYDAQWAPTWRERLGVRENVRFHDLRHTFASLLVSGATGRAWRLEEVQILLGHASRTTTERYAHLSPDSVAGAAADARELWRS